MCGRFTRQYTWKQVREFLDLRLPAPEEMLAPRYNVAPTQASPVCRVNESGERELVPMVWGFKPAWSDPKRPGPINARCETVATSPMFRAAFRARRCIVPASGFYEWKQTGRGKQPHYIRPVDERGLFAFAALWEPLAEGDERGTGEAARGTFTILTTRPNALLASIHDRMPVILPPENFQAWLSATEAPRDVFDPFPAKEMAAYPISTRVNSPRNDDAKLIERAEESTGEGEAGLFETKPTRRRRTKK